MKKQWQTLVGGGVLVALLLCVGWLVATLPGMLKPPSIGGLPDLRPQMTPTIYPSSITIVERVQELSRLETASYHMEKVISAESGQGPLGFLFGDKLLLIAYGEVIAGVDLGKIQPDDVTMTDDGTAYVKMPPVEVFGATLDNQRTYVYDRRTGVAGMNQTLETAARQEAEKQILQAALEEGVIEQAEKNARDVIRSLLIAMGARHVVFVEVMPTPTTVPTYTLTPIN